MRSQREVEEMIRIVRFFNDAQATKALEWVLSYDPPTLEDSQLVKMLEQKRGVSVAQMSKAAPNGRWRMTLLVAVRPDAWPDEPERFVREEIEESDLEDLNEFYERTLKPLLAALRKGQA